MDEEEYLNMSKEERKAILDKCEAMLKHRSNVYFDVQEFEILIDYYIDEQLDDIASSLIETALKQHPHSTEIKIKKAKLLLETGVNSDAVEALNILEYASQFEKGNFEIESLKGFCYIELNEFNTAQTYFDKALSYVETDNDLNYYIASNLINRDQFELAIKYLKQSYKQDATYIFTLYDLAYCYERTDQSEKSILFYNKFLDCEPYSDNAWYNLGIMYNKVELYAEAISAFDYAIAINDKNTSAYFNKANTLANCGEFAQAIDIYNDFLTFEPNNIITLFYIGECYEKQERNVEALQYYKKVLAIEPGFAEAWHGVGVVKYNEKKYSEAFYHLEKAIEIDGDNSEFWYTFGNVNKEIEGNEQKALYCYKRATELDPHDTEFWLNYAEIQKEVENISTAANTLEYAYKFLEEDAELDFILSAYYYELGNKNKSIEFFNKARCLDIDMAPAFFSNCKLKDEDRMIFTTILTQ